MTRTAGELLEVLDGGPCTLVVTVGKSTTRLGAVVLLPATSDGLAELLAALRASTKVRKVELIVGGLPCQRTYVVSTLNHGFPISRAKFMPLRPLFSLIAPPQSVRRAEISREIFARKSFTARIGPGKWSRGMGVSPVTVVGVCSHMKYGRAQDAARAPGLQPDARGTRGGRMRCSPCISSPDESDPQDEIQQEER